MTTVVYYSSTDAGAPTLNNAAGSMIALLDACLVNGFGTKAVTSISVTGGVATVVCSAHGFNTESVQEIVGATPALLNGRKRITVTGGNGFTFPAPGVPDGAATGTITAKRPGLGWVKEFASGSTKAVYKRTDPMATAMRLRVSDTGAGTYDTALDAEATMFEAMSSVDAGTGASPAAHGQTWAKGMGTATAARWILIGDSRTFYLFSSNDSGSNQWAAYSFLTPHAFGDIKSYRAADGFACMIHGPFTHSASTTAGFSYGVSIGGAPSPGGACYVARLSNAVAQTIPLGALGRGSGNLGSGNAPVYPSPVDNGGVIGFPLFAVESNSPFYHPIRGEFRGLAEPLFNCLGLGLTVFDDVVGSDRKWLVVPSSASPSDRAFVLVDLTGPWQS